MELTNSMITTIESVRLAMGASTLRQRAIAANIANAASPDHTRMKVVFEERLADALSQLQPGEALGQVEAELVQAGPLGEKVQVDQEMVDMSENTLRYQALSKGMSRYLSIASMIVSAGRG